MMEPVRAEHPGRRYTEPRGAETCFLACSRISKKTSVAGVEQGVEGVVENEVEIEGRLLRTLCAMLKTLAFILRRGAIEGFLRGITF